MKSKGISSLLLVLAVWIVTTNAAIAQQGGRQQKYSDDAIVRDLKAGKLTVREAQILQGRREQAALPAVKPDSKPAVKPVVKSAAKVPTKGNVKGGHGKSAQTKRIKPSSKAVKLAKTAKPASPGKTMKAAKPVAVKPKAKASLTHRINVSGNKHPTESATKNSKAASAAKHKNAVLKSINKQTASTRKTAVRYIK